MNTQDYFKTRLEHDKRRSSVWHVLADFIQPHIPKSSILLELGSGYCDFINAIHAREKHALDTFTELGNYAQKDIITHIMPASKITQFDDEQFDVVFASNFFEHIEMNECETVLAQVYRILKYHGKIIILQPNFKYGYKEYFDDYTHKTIFTHISFSDILKKNGFTIQKIIKKLLPFSIKKNLPKSSFLLWFYIRSPIRPFACQMFIVAEKQQKKR